MILTEHDRHCVTVLSPSGKKLQSFGIHGSIKEQFHEPYGVAVDDKGNILVADDCNYRIQKFTLDGQFIVSVGTQGGGSLPFSSLAGLAFNAYNNKIYVANCANNRLQVLNSDLTYSSTLGGRGGKGEFNLPHGVSCDSNVYVADTWNHCIQIFTPQGKFVSNMVVVGGSLMGQSVLLSMLTVSCMLASVIIIASLCLPPRVDF